MKTHHFTFQATRSNLKTAILWKCIKFFRTFQTTRRKLKSAFLPWKSNKPFAFTLRRRNLKTRRQKSTSVRPFSKRFPSTRKCKVGVYKFLQFQKCVLFNMDVVYTTPKKIWKRRFFPWLGLPSTLIRHQKGRKLTFRFSVDRKHLEKLFQNDDVPIMRWFFWLGFPQTQINIKWTENIWCVFREKSGWKSSETKNFKHSDRRHLLILLLITSFRAPLPWLRKTDIKHKLFLLVTICHFWCLQWLPPSLEPFQIVCLSVLYYLYLDKTVQLILVPGQLLLQQRKCISNWWLILLLETFLVSIVIWLFNWLALMI